MKRIRYILMIGLLIAGNVGVCQGYITYDPIKNDSLNRDEYYPEFPGGDDSLINFIKDNIKYPKIAKDSGIQGTVYVQFTINKDGNVINEKILRGIGGGCDEEALRVVKLMPKWEHITNRATVPVVWYNLPIKFTLPEKSEEENKK